MDKTKIFEAAGKLASKGQLDRAAKELQRILEADPKDVRALQKLAEIHQKSNRPKEATELLLRVAQGYAEQGFFLKAVSVYKQVLKLGDDRVEIHQRLAQLYQQLGLIGEATQQYQLVANQHDQSGNVRESLAALKRMVDLDPDNVASRVKLGELYARERMVPEAVQELDKAAAYLKKNQRSEDHLRVLERIGQLVPDDAAVARELAQSFLSRKDPRRALSMLQVCFRHDPKDAQTLSLLAEAFTDLGQPAKTVSVLRELARVHDETGAVEPRRQVLSRILELAPGDPDATEALASLAPAAVPAAAPPVSGTTPAEPPPLVLAPVDPQPVTSPRVAPATLEPPPSPTPAPLSPARAAAPPATGPESVDKLVIETDVFLKFRLVPKAAEHIARALALDPTSLPANERLLAIYDRQGKTAEAVALLGQMIELARAKGDGEREQQYLGDLSRRAPDHPALAAAAGPDDDLIIEPDELESAAALLVGEALDDETGFEIHTEATVPPPDVGAAATPALALWDDEGPTEEAVVLDSAAPGHLAPRPPIELDDDELDRALDRATGPHAREPEAGPSSVGPLAVLGEEVASPKPSPPAPASAEPPGRAKSVVTGPAPTGKPAERQEASRMTEGVPSDDEAGAPGADLFEEELAEAEFLSQQGLRDDALDVLNQVLARAPAHPRALALAKSLADAPLPALEPTGPAAKVPPSEPELADELDGAFEAIAAKARAETAPGLREGSASAAGPAPTAPSAADAEAAYDLGIGYFEMGRFDAAIAQLEAAIAGGRRTIDAWMALGLCQRERGDLTAAVGCFERALKAPGLTLEASKAAHYELGACAEDLEQVATAFEHFSRVVRADPAFRDAQARAQRLRPQVVGTNGEIKPVQQLPAIGRASVPPPGRPPPETPPAPAQGKRGKIGFL